MLTASIKVRSKQQVSIFNQNFQLMSSFSLKHLGLIAHLFFYAQEQIASSLLLAFSLLQHFSLAQILIK